MNEINLKMAHRILIILLLAAGPIHGGLAQQGTGAERPGSQAGLADVAAGFPEHLVVFTDRDLYAVNESIRFSAFLQPTGGPSHELGSRVMYAELVNAAGTAVAQGKYLLEEDRSAGSLRIPSSLPSGMYYLRSYTRWMRNFGPAAYSYLPVRVVNPYSDEVEGSPPASGKPPLAAVPADSRGMAMTADMGVYHAGDSVEVELSLRPEGPSQVLQGCLTVVPTGAIDTSAFLFGVDPVYAESPAFQFRYYPEPGGPSLSGMVVDASDRTPVPGVRVHMSILGKDPAYFVAESDPDGKFLMNVPSRTGLQELFVVPEPPSGAPVEVLIDQDFSSEALPFGPGTLDLHPEEEKLASRLSLNMQLQETFLTDPVLDESLSAGTASLPFYGIPEISVRMDEFVSLPSMEEVVENLLPKTFLVRGGGGVHFLIKSDNPLMSMFPPLILVDHIPVFDTEAILSVPPSKIRQIDVIPEVYVLGEFKFGGIISLTSVQGDLASIRLPEGSYFFDFLSFQAPSLPKQARYAGPAKIPDTRNTLCWMENLELFGKAPQKISFQAGSVPGDYLVLFRGLSPEGDVICGMEHLRVE
jgi:hypothetical protein